jgi:hypothetical protein
MMMMSIKEQTEKRIQELTVEFWHIPNQVNHKSTNGRLLLRNIYDEIQELKADLAMLEEYGREEFIKGVNAVTDKLPGYVSLVTGNNVVYIHPVKS